MANKGLLHDWVWFWQNGGQASAKNPTTVNKTSRLNLTVSEAKNNYRLNKDLLNGLSNNTMIAHDAIEFLTALGFNGPVFTSDYIVVSNNSSSNPTSVFLFVGGDFTEVDGVPCNYFATFRCDTIPNYELIVDWGGGPGGGFNAPVRAITIGKSRTNSSSYQVNIGGDFTKFNGYEVGYFVSASLSQGIPEDYQVGKNKYFNGPVYTIAKHRNSTSDDLYIGGNFTTCKGSERKYFARYSLNGSVSGSTNKFNGPIYSMKCIQSAEATSDLLAVGGEFSGTDVHGKPFKNFVIVNLDGDNFNKIWRTGHNSASYLNSWEVDGPVYAVETYDHGGTPNVDGSGTRLRACIIIGGEFKSINGESYTNCAILGPLGYRNHTGYYQSTYDLSTDGPVYAIYCRDEHIVHVGGAFSMVYFKAQHNMWATPTAVDNFFTFYPAYPKKAVGESAFPKNFLVAPINTFDFGIKNATVKHISKLYVGDVFYNSESVGVVIGGYITNTSRDQPIKNFIGNNVLKNLDSEYFNFNIEPNSYFVERFKDVDA